MFQVRKMRIEKRANEIVNRLNKTKIETHPDFRAERERRDADERAGKKQVNKAQKEVEKVNENKRREEAELRSYSSLHKSENMTTNYENNNDSDDFF